MQVIEAVAAETGRDPKDLPPLYNAIDPDALNALFDRPISRRQQTDTGTLEVDFELAGCDVTVSMSDGIGVVRKLSADGGT